MHQLPNTIAPAGQAIATAPADGRQPLAWLARNPPSWTIEAARAAAGDMPLAEIGTAEAEIAADLAPVPDGDRREKWEEAMHERIRRLGLKVAPGWSVEQAREWATVQIEMLDDLPAMIVLTAVKMAIKSRIHFPNEVEPAVRAIAEEMVDRRKLGLKRLADLRDAIERPVVALPPPPPAPPPTPDEIADLNASMKRLGLRVRFDEAGDSYELDARAWADERANAPEEIARRERQQSANEIVRKMQADNEAAILADQIDSWLDYEEMRLGKGDPWFEEFGRVHAALIGPARAQRQAALSNDTTRAEELAPNE